MTKFDEFGLPEPTKYPQMPKVIKMNKRIRELVKQSGGEFWQRLENDVVNPEAYITFDPPESLEKFAELIVEATLDQVKERAYYTGDRDWSDAVDRPWIQLEFGYGPLHDAKGVEK